MEKLLQSVNKDCKNVALRVPVLLDHSKQGNTRGRGVLLKGHSCHRPKGLSQSVTKTFDPT